jgi:S-formylglutathione hydrolase FrmB
MSGFLPPSRTTFNGAIIAGMAKYGGVDIRNMWGLPQLGRWKWHDPDVDVKLLVDNDTQVWIFSPGDGDGQRPGGDDRHPAQTQGSKRSFLNDFREFGGTNATLTCPRAEIAVGRAGRHSWRRCRVTLPPPSNNDDPKMNYTAGATSTSE